MKKLQFLIGWRYFDVSILELGDGVFEVKASNGDGILVVMTLIKGINWIADEFKKSDGIDLREDPMALQRLKEAVRQQKKSYLLQNKQTLIYHLLLQMHQDQSI